MRRSLLYFELRRLFVSRVFILLVFLLSVFNIIKIHETYLENEQLHQLTVANANVMCAFEKLNAQFEGELTNEKITHFMVNYYQPIIDQVADFTASINSASEVDLTCNPYIDKALVAQFFYIPMQYSYLYAFQSADTTERAEYQAVLAKDTFHKKKFTRIMESFKGRAITEFHHVENFEWYFSHTFSTFLLLFFLLYGLSRIFLSLDHLKIEELLITCPRGGLPRMWAKVFALTIFMVTLTIYFSFLDVTAFSLIFPNIQHWNMPLFSLSSCANTPLNITLFQVGLLSLCIKVLGILILSYFLILLTERVHHVFIPFIVISLIIVALTVVAELSIGTHKWLLRLINPMSYLICNINFFSSTEFFPLFAKPLFIYEAAFFFGVFLLSFLFVLLFLFSRNNLWRKNIVFEIFRKFNRKNRRIVVREGDKV